VVVCGLLGQPKEEYLKYSAFHSYLSFITPLLVYKFPYWLLI
jgi:hypothetical protein